MLQSIIEITTSLVLAFNIIFLEWVIIERIETWCALERSKREMEAKRKSADGEKV